MRSLVTEMTDPGDELQASHPLRERSFIPPLLSLSASPLLLSELSDLLHRLAARRKRLMAMRRESNERMADFAVADVSLFWLLNALNSVEPVLTELHGRRPAIRNCCTASWPALPAAC